LKVNLAMTCMSGENMWSSYPLKRNLIFWHNEFSPNKWCCSYSLASQWVNESPVNGKEDPIACVIDLTLEKLLRTKSIQWMTFKETLNIENVPSHPRIW